MAEDIEIELLLTQLILDKDLEDLESRLAQFNIFEAIGVIQRELNHSSFLAFLLNPRQSHGLGDRFVKRLLQKVVLSVPSGTLPISAIDVDVWDWDQLVIKCEEQHIDLLLLDESHELAVIIENKIGSSEHSNQLKRYWDNVSNEHLGWRIIGLYLTPDNDPPEGDDRYIPVGYTTIIESIQDCLMHPSPMMDKDAQTLMEHYVEIIRRRIVNEDKIVELCRQIYKKHQKAIEKIIESREDSQLAIWNMIKELIQQGPDLLYMTSSTKSGINFVPQEWEVPALRVEEGFQGHSSGQILVFSFENSQSRLVLRLTICPDGPATDRRQRLFHMAQSRKELFKPARKTLQASWNTIYQLRFLEAGDYANSDEELEQKIRERWSVFLKNDLPSIRMALKAETWIWQPTTEHDTSTGN